MERIDPSRTDRITPNRSKHEINTQEHDTNTRLSSDRALSTRSLFPPETWDHFPLSPVCTPYCKLLVLVTRAAATNQMQGLSARTCINIVSSKHTIRARRAILEIYSLVVTRNTKKYLSQVIYYLKIESLQTHLRCQRSWIGRPRLWFMIFGVFQGQQATIVVSFLISPRQLSP